ncbi:MAG: hypothetical protein PHI97_12420 [Desulfobulbus sp.]|nr:hypothetical protein [Desulfobulbus sp.]
MSKFTLKSVSRKSPIKAAIMLMALTVFFGGTAFAMTTPAATSFAYDIYNIGVNQILLGPIGFVAGVAFVILAAVLALRNMYVPAGGIVLAAAFMLNADTVITSMGAMII